MRTVALVGLSPQRGQAKELPDNVEIWSLNHAHKYGFRIDLLLELHKWEDISGPDCYGEELREKHLNFLKTAKIPIYMQELHPLVPASQLYPYEDARRLAFGKKRFNSSFDWMAALAIIEKVDKAIIIGFEMDYFETEYRYQKPSALYWLRAMEDAGIEVEDRCLFQERKLYAYEDAQMIHRHKAELKKKKYQKQYDHFMSKKQYWDGVLAERLSAKGNRKYAMEAAEQSKMFELSAAQAQGAVMVMEELLGEHDKDEDG